MPIESVQQIKPSRCHLSTKTKALIVGVAAVAGGLLASCKPAERPQEKEPEQIHRVYDTGLAKEIINEKYTKDSIEYANACANSDKRLAVQNLNHVKALGKKLPMGIYYKNKNNPEQFALEVLDKLGLSNGKEYYELCQTYEKNKEEAQRKVDIATGKIAEQIKTDKENALAACDSITGGNYMNIDKHCETINNYLNGYAPSGVFIYRTSDVSHVKEGLIL